MSDDTPNSDDALDADQPVASGASEEADAEPDELTRLVQERAELVATLQRMQADFENLRKRLQRDQQVAIERASEKLVDQLLPVLDNFELALTSLEADEHGLIAAEKVRKGVELVFAEFVSVLEKAGLERIDAHGAPFDPEQHEAVLEIEGDGEQPVVADIMRTGYVFKGRVLRPAMVKVAR